MVDLMIDQAHPHTVRKMGILLVIGMWSLDLALTRLRGIAVFTGFTEIEVLQISQII